MNNDKEFLIPKLLSLFHENSQDLLLVLNAILHSSRNTRNLDQNYIPLEDLLSLCHIPSKTLLGSVESLERIGAILLSRNPLKTKILGVSLSSLNIYELFEAKRIGVIKELRRKEVELKNRINNEVYFKCIECESVFDQLEVAGFDNVDEICDHCHNGKLVLFYGLVEDVEEYEYCLRLIKYLEG